VEFYVSKKRTKITSNPFLDVDAPNVIAGESSGELLSPVVLSTSALSGVAAPVGITELSPGALSAPINIAELSAASLSVPVDITELSAASLSVPVDITELPPIALGVPGIIAGLAAGNLLVPNYINESPAVNVSAPININELAATALSAPINITEKSAGSLSVPVSITAVSVDPESPPFALNHARILYNNLLTSSTVSPSTGSNANYTLIPNTAQRWTFTGGASESILFTLPANQNIDTVCISSHNFAGGTVEAFYDVDATAGGFVSMGVKTPTSSNDAIMWHMSSAVSIRRIQINVYNSPASSFLGSVYAGVALQMQRPFFGGHTPAVLARRAEYFGSNTESGQFIGTQVRRRAYESEAQWKNLSDTWYRAYFQPFTVVAETLPFYFAWNLLEYPSDVVYCKPITNITPQYQGQRNLMSVDIPLMGIA